MSRPGILPPQTPPLSLHHSPTSQAIFLTGPSKACRKAALTKRQLAAGKILNGRAAKLKRRAELKARGVQDEEDLESMSSTFGEPGFPYISSIDQDEVCELPSSLHLQVSSGESAACAALLTYHKHACMGMPDTPQGRDHALAQGWSGVQQALAIAGHHRRSTRVCNMCVCVHGEEGMVGILAACLHSSMRSVSVLAIHVAPSMRGPLQLPNRMWQRACDCVAQEARMNGVTKVRFSLEIPCCQSQQGAYFWIHRMGWDGTVEAREAASAWQTHPGHWLPGDYDLWYELYV